MAQINICRITVTLTTAVLARRFVTATGALPAANGNAIGVTFNDAETGDAVAVTTLGVADVVAAGAITAGAAVAVAADGRVVAHTTGTVVGRAVTASAAAGDIVDVHLIPN